MLISAPKEPFDDELRTALVLLASGLSPAKVRVKGMALVQKPMLRLKLGIHLLDLADSATEADLQVHYRDLARTIGVSQAMRALVRDFEAEHQVSWFDVPSEDKADWLDELDALCQEREECLSCMGASCNAAS